ncbi:MAG: hypothetical protein GC149_05930 [Gammaproteobacteria bacterium]|nr:hypothetical protein [Gammaproteobacteria bacterium]
MEQPLTGKQFYNRLRYLILTSWVVPPVFGFSSLVYINMFTSREVVDILSSPIELLYIVIWIALAVWYLPYRLKPVSLFLDMPARHDENRVQDLLRSFPVYFWAAFLFYVLLAPASVILSAMGYSDYVFNPVDWLRLHLMALIVSIIVGLPLFFLILNLFGKVAPRLQLKKPHIRLKSKVFLIGALMPLLIDTMLVQYYWSRTGYFTRETFFVWLTLEILAICGSLIFVRSIGQSLSPLQTLIDKDSGMSHLGAALIPKSTDELGVITYDYHQMLEELDTHRHELEVQVDKRTQELTTINMELESFAYSVSHDLRAPLRSINGFAHILFENYARELDEEGRDYLQRIMDSSARMSQIIDGLLNLSRMTRTSLKLEKVDLSAMVAEILKTQKANKSERLIETRVLPGLTITADKNLIHIMLENLLSNALKFTAYKKHTIIEVGMTEKEGEPWFYISDNGAGFEMRFADKLFQAFQRLHPQYEFEGIGIGLATVKRIVNLHGGKIWAEAKPDEGATFYFRL